jgi:uncharacterized protein (TIGR02246 family)
MPRANLILPAALFAMLVTTSCARSGEKDAQAEHQQEIQQARAADEAAIRAAVAAWSQASAAKDLDKAMSYYTDDVVQMSPKSPVVKGKENVRKNWGAMLAEPGPGLTFQSTAIEVARSGEIAYEAGTYDYLTTDKQGKTTDEKGKYLIIWKKQNDGSWKAAIDIDNTDQ